MFIVRVGRKMLEHDDNDGGLRGDGSCGGATDDCKEKGESNL